MTFIPVSFLVPKIKARACNTGGQLIPKNGTILNLDTKDFDPYNIVDLANDRIVPNVAGYYFCSSSVRLDNVPQQVYMSINIFKNGNLECIGNQPTTFVNGSTPSSTCYGLIYCNGSSDYLQIFVYHDSNSQVYVSANRALNFVSVIGPF